MSGDGGDSQDPVGVPPLGGTKYHRDDRKTRGRRRLGVPCSSGGNGIRRSPPHRGIHQEMTDIHIGKGACGPIYDICMEEDRMPGTSRMLLWWDQGAVNEPEE